MFRKILITIFILSLSPSLFPQSSVNIVGRDTRFVAIFDDSVAAVLSKVLKPSVNHITWFRTSLIYYHSFWVTLSPGSGTFFSEVGFGATDTVKVTYLGYSNGDTPTSSSAGFVEQTEGAAKSLFNITAADTTAVRKKFYVSAHGPGDPEIALMQFIQFTSEVIGGFTNGGLTIRFGYERQP